MPPAVPDFSTLFELLPIGAYRSTPEGRQVRANAALVRLNGYASEVEMLASVKDIGSEWYVDPGRRAEFKRLLERDGQVRDFVSEVFRHKTRERIWVCENAHAVRDAQGAVLLYEGTIEDVSAERATRVALEASERRFRALIEKAQLLTLVCDAQGIVRYASPAAQMLLGRAPQSLLGASVFDTIHAEDQARARTEFESVLDGRSTGLEASARFGHADGSWRHLSALANNCLADSAIAGIVLHLRDVTERMRAEDALRRLADHDALTDLPNRRYLLERVAQALTQSQTRSQRLNALIYIDLDGFKEVNDSHGHDAGDRLLRAVAERMTHCVRAVDTVARFGGDEFVILLEDLDVDRVAAGEQARRVGEKLLAVGEAASDLGDLASRCSCSVGVTLFGDRQEAIDDILRRADHAMYEAKRSGRNHLRMG